MENLNRHSFQRVLGRTDVLALSIGTIIGWGWVALTGAWITTGGVLGSSGAFLVGAILFILIGNVYAELAAALPVAGGEIAFSYRALGYNAATFVGWTITFGGDCSICRAGIFVSGHRIPMGSSGNFWSCRYHYVEFFRNPSRNNLSGYYYFRHDAEWFSLFLFQYILRGCAEYGSLFHG